MATSCRLNLCALPVFLASGRLLVFAEARESSSDNGSNDLALKRSDAALFTVLAHGSRVPFTAC